MIKLFAVTAFSVGMVTGAMAQSTSPATPTTPPAAPSSAMPSDWSGAISEAFFADKSGSALRTDDEIRERWSSLAGEQQDQVRADCETISSTNMGTGSSDSTSTPSMDAGTSDAAPSGNAADTSMSANAMPLDHVCDLIKDL